MPVRPISFAALQLEQLRCQTGGAPRDAKASKHQDFIRIGLAQDQRCDLKKVKRTKMNVDGEN
jgi:hypothetical protein